MSVTITHVNEAHAGQTIDLLRALRVSFLGLESRRVHAALVRDALAGRLDCRVAVESGRVLGFVIAAPAVYWASLPAQRPDIAAAVIWSRLRSTLSTFGRQAGGDRAVHASAAPVVMRTDPPPRTWRHPGDAWRVVFVGTSPLARGRGVAAALYRSLMAERSLVARIALDNPASLRLHVATGWALYRDGSVALAVHVADRVNRAAPERAAESRAAVPPATGSGRTTSAPRSAAR